MKHTLEYELPVTWGRMTMCEAAGISPAFNSPVAATGLVSPSSCLQPGSRNVEVRVGEARLMGTLAWPCHPSGFVLFTRTGGRRGQDRLLSERLQREGFGTLLIDRILGSRRSGSELKAGHFQPLVEWLARQPEAAGRPVGCLGLGAAATGALVAARSSARIGAVVLCGGYPRLEQLFAVRVPTLLITGEEDYERLRLAHPELVRLGGSACLMSIPGTGPLGDPHGLEQAGSRAAQWFVRHLIMEPACRAAHARLPGGTDHGKAV